MTDTTPTDTTADETVERLIREASGHVSGEGLRLDVDELRRVLHLAITAGASAWRERAEQAEGGRKRFVKRIRAVEAERDALRARIEAAKAIVRRDLAGSVASSLSAALAGDQTEGAHS